MVTVTVTTYCGLQTTGVVVADRPEAITLRIAGVREVTIPRARIADVAIRQFTTAA